MCGRLKKIRRRRRMAMKFSSFAFLFKKFLSNELLLSRYACWAIISAVVWPQIRQKKYYKRRPSVTKDCKSNQAEVNLIFLCQRTIFLQTVRFSHLTNVPFGTLPPAISGLNSLTPKLLSSIQLSSFLHKSPDSII